MSSSTTTTTTASQARGSLGATTYDPACSPNVLTTLSTKNVQVFHGRPLWPTIIYDPSIPAVLGLVYSSRESLEQSMVEKRCVFYSRSRDALWIKSGTTGQNAPRLVDIQLDCDRDALLFVVHTTPSQHFCHVPLQTSCFSESLFPVSQRSSPTPIRIGVVKGHTKPHAMNLLEKIGIHVYESAQSRNDRSVVYRAKSHLSDTRGMELYLYKKADAYQALCRGEVDLIVGFDDILMTMTPVNSSVTTTTKTDSQESKHSSIVSWYPLRDVTVRVVGAARPGYQPTPGSTLRVRSEYHHAVLVISFLEKHFPRRTFDIQYVHGGSELFVSKDLADVAIVVSDTGASLRNHGLVELGPVATHTLSVHFLRQTYLSKPNRRFFRQLRTDLSSNTIYFYTTDGPYGFMSNFALYPFRCHDHNLVWPSTEHYYQAHKFTPHSLEWNAVRSAASPKECYKRAWTFASRFTTATDSKTPNTDWAARKDQVMWKALQYKFGQHPNLMKRLLETKGQVLVEHALNDFHYGCGHDNTGLNMLGRMLMDIRDGTFLRQTHTSTSATAASPVLRSKL